MKHSIDLLRAAVRRIHNKAMGKSDEPYMSIPARPEVDADLILESAIDELAALREELKTDGEVFNRGRHEGRSDVAARLRSIVDPKDEGHWNLDGLMAVVEELQAENISLRSVARGKR